MPISLDDQIRCVAREIAMRRAVYPRRVAEGKMTTGKMQLEIVHMEAVLSTLIMAREHAQDPGSAFAGPPANGNAK